MATIYETEGLLNQKEWITELNLQYPSDDDLDAMLEIDLADKIYTRLATAINTKGIPFSPRIVAFLKSRIATRDIISEMISEIPYYLTLLRRRNWHEAVRMLLPSGFEEEDTKRTAKSQLRQQWIEEYCGQSLEAFIEKLGNAELNWDEEKFYAKAFYIIQSSGTGKSRLMEEFGKEVMTLSFTLREECDTGFPLGDCEIQQFLCSPNSSEVCVDVHARAISLLGAVVQNVLSWYTQNQSHPKWLQEWTKILAPPPNDAPEDDDIVVVEDDYRSEFREEFCRDIVTLAEKILGEIKQERWYWSSDYEYEKCLVFTAHLHDPLRQLLRLLENGSTAEKYLPLLVLAFDGAENLDSQMHAALRHVMRSLREWPVWVILLSTDSDITRFVPPHSKDLSSRIIGGKLKHINYFVGLELDIKAREQSTMGHELVKPIRRFSTTEHMTMFGRPLWQVHSTSQYIELRRFVALKLLGGQEEFRPYDCHHAFAVLAFRLYLDLIDSSHIIAKEAVKSHLRLLLAIDSYSGVVNTTTPSEPVVADAAAWLLLQPKPQPSGSNINGSNWTECLTILAEHFLSRGIVDKGRKGELYARLMCVLARDYLLEETESGPSQKPGYTNIHQECAYSRPFLCKDFLGRLTGKPILKDFTIHHRGRLTYESKETGIFTPSDFGDYLERLLCTAYMNFNHFTKTPKPLSPETLQDLLHSLLRQNSALQLCFEQQHWDLLIPIYFGDLDEDFNVSQLSAVFIQVKNRVNEDRIPLGKEYREIFKGWNPRLVILLQMDFTNTKSASEIDIRLPEFGKVEPCVFGIRLVGSGMETYPVLQKDKLGDACAKLVRTLVYENSDIESILCERMARI